MNAQARPHQLGHNILVVLDRTPAPLDALRHLTTALPQLPQTFFTLLCCCPTHYWEHGGANTPGASTEVEQVWLDEERDFTLAEQCQDRATSILHAAGVDPSHIVVHTSTEDSLLDATVAELRRGDYTGVVVSRFHHELVNRLLHKGVTDRFRHLPEVAVWAVEASAEGQAPR